VIAKLDRLARNVAFISNLMESGVDFVAVDFPQANRLTVHILAAVAEHEAKLISERTKAALAAARARGQQLGGDRDIREIAHLGRLASAQLRQERARQRAADLGQIIADLRKRGVTSLRQIAAERAWASGPSWRSLGTGAGPSRHRSVRSMRRVLEQASQA
jgi:DNA invertase Pin-like site-specific DNA recombinase